MPASETGRKPAGVSPRFCHFWQDWQFNIMTSLAAYIGEKKYEELGTFFYEHIFPMQKNDALNNLLHVCLLG